ncbi:Transamidase GatB domain protein [hydrothermal vent metagenome]|uniref:Transamidase GatB domain protein n=1 Tax=hydrothermal vent metagenome TaxID=652676 RepID=A0A1W1BJS2_9ZZZZ
MSDLKAKLVLDIKTAMKAKEKDKLATLRLILATIKQKEVDERIELTDKDILIILQKMQKQRKESIAQFKLGNREDLIAQEKLEMDIIQTYLPEQLNENEVVEIVEKTIVETNAQSMQDMGKLMGVLKGKLDGRADMSFVSQLIKKSLS